MKADQEPSEFGELQSEPPPDEAMPRGVFTVVAAAFLFMVLLGTAFASPWVLQELDQFAVPLPLISIVALHPFVPFGLGLLLTLTIAKDFLIRNPRVIFACNATALGLGSVILVAYLFGAITPFVLLVDGLS